jgi:DNA polymerase III subunit epsilon
MILILDVETSGLPSRRWPDLDWRQPHIVELAATLVDRRNTTLAEMSRIVRPDGWVSSPGALAVHGITREQALAEGLPEGEVLWEFLKLARRASLVVAHNAEFEDHVVRIGLARFWPQHVDEWGRRAKFCTMLAARRACGVGKLALAYEKLCGQPHGSMHEAIGDVDAARGIYFALPVTAESLAGQPADGW